VLAGLALMLASASTASATIIGTGTTLGGDVYNVDDGLFVDPTGFALGTYISGADGQGWSDTPTNFNYCYGCGTGVGNGNARDFYWLHDQANWAYIDGVWGGNPVNGLQFDLGGQANKVVVFPSIDHGPLPEEALEHTVYLSNDLLAWTRATLETAYQEGWSPDPNIADGWVGVYSGAPSTTWRYASVVHGGASSLITDGDTEIDAVGGLTESGGGVNVPEPATALLLGAGFAGLALVRRFKK
ncbi:MAG: PEP-CTERM sorting domain-containing protein, partial [Deltaproteobacteria bacterium]|nr:PEP-CTERM sorting domain-containing protein [Deltaproteobacteria bacterium]